MKGFILGLILGSVLTGTLVGAGDPLGLGRSETQQQYDYFRGRALQMDVENMRREQQEEKIRNLGKSPC